MKIISVLFKAVKEPRVTCSILLLKLTFLFIFLTVFSAGVLYADTPTVTQTITPSVTATVTATAGTPLATVTLSPTANPTHVALMKARIKQILTTNIIVKNNPTTVIKTKVYDKLDSYFGYMDAIAERIYLYLRFKGYTPAQINNYFTNKGIMLKVVDMMKKDGWL